MAGTVGTESNCRRIIGVQLLRSRRGAFESPGPEYGLDQYYLLCPVRSLFHPVQWQTDERSLSAPSALSAEVCSRACTSRGGPHVPGYGGKNDVGCHSRGSPAVPRCPEQHTPRSKRKFVWSRESIRPASLPVEANSSGASPLAGRKQSFVSQRQPKPPRLIGRLSHPRKGQPSKLAPSNNTERCELGQRENKPQ